MQMYANEYNDANNTSEKRERKKHRKTHDGSHNESGKLNGGKLKPVENEGSGLDLQRRRSEEENYEPSNDSRRKHRHHRNKTEEDCPEPTETNVTIQVKGDDRTIEEQEEARRLRREKKRRARERRKPREDLNNHVQSPLSDENDIDNYDEIHNPELELQINEFEPELMLGEEDSHANPIAEQPKPKKKKGGFAKIFASLKKKTKSTKREEQTNAQSESNPDIIDPTVDNQAGTMDKPKKKIRGKSTRDLDITKAHVIQLDGEEVEIEVDHKATGAVLFMRVCDDIDLIEKDFFGMTYVSSKLQTWFWLEMDKKINKQLGKDDEWTFNFQVKFYPPEPLLLQEDLTRYLLSLQVRQDVYTGKLPCSWITQALLGSFMVQSELGDYDEIVNAGGIEYLREFEFVLNQSDQLLEKICELHKKHVGMSPERADIKYMETAKRLEQYGVDLHPARDNDDVEIFIGISYQGILIYRDRLKIGRFAWPKVIRISYKKHYFYLKIRSERYDDSVAVVGFKLFNHHLAKRLWKNAAEQHTFFRMKETQMNKSVSRIASNTSSSSGYSCKTLHQYRSMNIIRTQPVHFDRTISKRRTIGSMPANLNRAGLQYSSMHSLNRAHPRDMTLGKTKSVEYLSGKRPGSTADLTYGREDSMSSFINPRPLQKPLFRPYGAVSKDDDGRHSFRSGDSVNCGESYTVNNDDQMSLPSMSHQGRQDFSRPKNAKRSDTSSIDGLSEDGIISRPGTSKPVPLPLPPDSDSSDSDVTDSIQKPAFRFQPKKPVPSQNGGQGRSVQAPPPLPEPPSASSSVRSSPTAQYMPPPPMNLDSPVDTHRNMYDKAPSADQSRPVIKPKPVVQTKPNAVVKERIVITKAPVRRREDAASHKDML